MSSELEFELLDDGAVEVNDCNTAFNHALLQVREGMSVQELIDQFRDLNAKLLNVGNDGTGDQSSVVITGAIGPCEKTQAIADGVQVANRHDADGEEHEKAQLPEGSRALVLNAVVRVLQPSAVGDAVKPVG